MRFHLRSPASHAIFTPLQSCRTFSSTTFLLRTKGPVPRTQPKKTQALERPRSELTAQQAESVTKALRARLAQLSAQDEPFFRVDRKVRRVWSSLLNSLHQSLRKSLSDPTSPLYQSRLWADYTLAKRTGVIIQNFRDLAWDALWTTQSIETPSNPKPHERQAELLADMESLGRELTLPQRLGNLERLYAQGEKKEAIIQWEEGYDLRGNLGTDGHKADYLDFGVRMYLADGNIERAGALATELFDIHPTWNSRILMSVALAHIQTGNAERLEQGFVFYQKLISLMGSELSQSEYDSILLEFLKAKQPMKAKAVFKDMVSHRKLATTTTNEDAQEMSKRLKTIWSFCQNEQELNEVGLVALSVLPTSYGEILFTDWLTTMLYHKHPESTLKIVELMYERGVTPRAKHFNLMIHSLFGSGNPEALEQAEALAWGMIERRISHLPVPFSRQKKWTISRVPFFLERDIPVGNSSTFAALITHYASTRRWEAVTEVKQILEQYSWHPTEPQLLHGLLLADILSGEFESVWRRYRSQILTPDADKRIHPTGRTFQLLWRCLRKGSYDDDMIVEGSPSPRELMAHMVSWAFANQSYVAWKGYLRRFSANEGSLGNIISGSFWLNRDLAGQLVSIHIMYRLFDVAPSPRTIRAIYKQLCYIKLPPSTRRLRRDREFSSRMERIVKVHEMLRQRRVDAAVAQGEEAVKQLQENGALFTLNTLSELIRVIMVREYSPAEVESMIDECKKEMGVPHYAIGDVDAFHVS